MAAFKVDETLFSRQCFLTRIEKSLKIMIKAMVKSMVEK